MKYLAKLTAVFIMGGSIALSGGTTLSNAVISGNLESVKACMKGGEKVNELDKWGWTPLLWAVYDRYLPITEYLLANGADPNIQADKAYSSLSKGATALVIASYYGLDDQAEALVNKGAKVDIVDGNGKTAMDYAKQYEFTAVVDILTNGGGVKSGAVTTSHKTDLGKGVDGSVLSKTYSKIVLEDFTAKKEITKDYADAVTDCQTNALAVILQKRGFEKVEMATAGKSYDASTLLVSVEITELRIASNAARFWVGAMAGSSYVHAKVKLVNGASGKVEREQLLTTENNAWGAEWTGGATDRSIPKDMGAIIAGYIITVAGKQ